MNAMHLGPQFTTSRPPLMTDAKDAAAAMGTLDELAQLANKEHRQCEVARKSGLQHAIKAGAHLIEAKSRCRHGDWLPWLAANFEGSERLAQAYMKVAANPQRVADLSFRNALKALAAPTAPPSWMQRLENATRELAEIPAAMEREDAHMQLFRRFLDAVLYEAEIQSLPPDADLWESSIAWRAFHPLNCEILERRPLSHEHARDLTEATHRGADELKRLLAVKFGDEAGARCAADTVNAMLLIIERGTAGGAA